jgi:hypothetical protein
LLAIARPRSVRPWRGRLAAAHGSVQTLFVTGEAGAGKTALANHLLENVADGGKLWIARGQCDPGTGPSNVTTPWVQREPPGRWLARTLDHDTTVKGRRRAEQKLDPLLGRHDPTRQLRIDICSCE